MLIFPQLSSGASAQYPIRKQVLRRSVQSLLEDGTIISSADSFASVIRWRIAFQGITDQEAGILLAFYASTQGSRQSFLFPDPASNLLVWSQDLTQSVWNTTGLTLDTGIADPSGGTQAFTAHPAGDASIVQQTQIPGLLQVCFSVYLRSAAPVTAELVHSAGSQIQIAPVIVTAEWRRFYVTGAFSASTDPCSFAISLPAGSSVSVYGPQVDSQVNPSQYVPSAGASAVCQDARFDMDRMAITATGPNQNACVVSIRCNVTSEG